MSPRMVTWTLSLVAIVLNSIIILIAIGLGFHIGSSPSDLANSTKGQAMAYLAVPGLVLSIIAHVLNSRQTRSETAGRVITIIALACALIGVVLFLVLPWR